MVRVNTRPSSPPHGVPDTESQDAITKLLDQLARHPTPDALDTYRQLWQDGVRENDPTTSTIEEHPKHDLAERALQTIFNATYNHPHNTQKDIRSNVTRIQCEKFDWFPALRGLRLYAHFGAESMTRMFLTNLRNLASMRTTVEDRDAEQELAEGEEGHIHTTTRGLTFLEALTLLKEAAKKRQMAGYNSRGARKACYWRPVDCLAAAEIAKERFGMRHLSTEEPRHQHTNRTARSPRLHATSSGAALHAGGEDGAGKISNDSPDGRGGDNNDDDGDQDNNEEEDDDNNDDNEDGDLFSHASSPAPSPERGRGGGGGGAAAAFVTRDASSVASTPAAPAATPPPSFPAFSPKLRLLSPIHTPAITDRTNTSSPLSSIIDSFTGLPGRPLARLDDSPRSSTSRHDAMDQRRKRQAEFPLPEPPHHRQGQTSIFKRARLDIAEPHLGGRSHYLNLAAGFLSVFAPTYSIERSTSGDTQHPFIAVHDLNNNTAPHGTFVIVLVPPSDGQEQSGWLVALVLLFTDGRRPTVELFSRSLPLSEGTRDRARDTVSAAVHRFFVAQEIQALSKESYIATRMPGYLDVRDQDPVDFIAGLAVCVCLLHNVEPPPKIFVWAWLGALANLNASSSRVTELVDSVDAPELPPPPQGETPTDHMGTTLNTCKAHLTTLEREITLVNAYHDELQRIQGCIPSVDAVRPAKSSPPALLQTKIDCCTRLLDAMGPDDPDRPTTEANLRKYQQESAESAASADRSRLLPTMCAWIDLSFEKIGSMREDRSEKRDGMRKLLAEMVEEAQKMVRSFGE